MPWSSSAYTGSLRACAALALLSLAACPTETVGPGTTTKYGPLYGEELKVHVPGDIVAVTVWVVAAASARDFDNPVTLVGAEIEFSVADPTVARVSGPSTVTTSQDGFHRAQAVAHLEYLKEGTTTLTARVANATWIDPAPLPGGSPGPFPVSRDFPVKSERPDHIEFSPASPLFIESRLASLEVSGLLISTLGSGLHGSDLRWSCPQGEGVARLLGRSGGECSGSDSTVTLYPMQSGTTVFHASAPAAMFARYPISGDLQLSVTNPVARIDLTATGLIRIGSATPITPAFRDAQGNLLPANLALLSPAISSNWRLADRLWWTSSDPSIATVDNSGAVTGVAPGSVTITATYYQFNADAVRIGTFASGSLAISVQPSSNIVVVDPTSALVTVDGIKLLGARVTDAAGHSISASITWVSQNSSILVAEDNGIALGTNSGRIIGVSTGVPSTTPSATVEVWVRAAGALAIVPVTVYRAVATALISPATYTLHPGEHVQLAASLQDGSGNTVPNAATSIDWLALDPGTATVNSFGMVTAVAVNATPARIRVQSTDGSTTLANITVASVPVGGVPAGIVLLPTGTVHLGVGVSQVFTAYLVDAQGNRTAPASGFAIGILTDVSGVAQAFNSSFSTAQLWQTATVQGVGVGTTPLRASYYNTVSGESTFSAFTTITVP